MYVEYVEAFVVRMCSVGLYAPYTLQNVSNTTIIRQHINS
jgi:hypothetical protein